MSQEERVTDTAVSPVKSLSEQIQERHEKIRQAGKDAVVKGAIKLFPGFGTGAEELVLSNRTTAAVLFTEDYSVGVLRPLFLTPLLEKEGESGARLYLAGRNFLPHATIIESDHSVGVLDNNIVRGIGELLMHSEQQDAGLFSEVVFDGANFVLLASVLPTHLLPVRAAIDGYLTSIGLTQRQPPIGVLFHMTLARVIEAPKQGTLEEFAQYPFAIPGGVVFEPANIEEIYCGATYPLVAVQPANRLL